MKTKLTQEELLTRNLAITKKYEELRAKNVKQYDILNALADATDLSMEHIKHIITETKRKTIW